MPGISKAFFKVEVGQLVAYKEEQFKITHLISVESVLALNLRTLESERLRIDGIKLVANDDGLKDRGVAGHIDLTLYSEEEWAEAQRRFLVIKPLLENPIRSRTDAEKIADSSGVHVATLYRWLKNYQEAGHVSALVPSKRGRKYGSKLLAQEQEKIVESVIEDIYLNKQRHKPQDVIEEVNRRCRLAKIVAPHSNTVRHRLNLLDPAATMRRRGFQEAARNKYAPILGQFPGADYPLAVVQIDHTEADIILVDEVHRKPIGRPWMTLAIDVCTRTVAGLYITYEKPSAASVGMCIAHAICPKREYLAELGIEGDWSVWGVMSVVHTDNAKEFRGVVLDRACVEYNIDLQWRPVLLPHYGGHIERLMGTMANEIRKLPGATFSNPTKRKGYDSEKYAAMTLKEFERYLVDFIVNVYHQRVHSQLGMSPRRKWELGVMGDEHLTGTGIMPIPEDPLRVRLDFMPFFERTVQQYGIKIDCITYYDHILDPYINSVDPENKREKKAFIVRRDPRDISKIYFFDPADNRYVVIPYRNIGQPAMSAWELKEVQQLLKTQGKEDVDEAMIFEALGRMRSRIEEAKHKTKAARRQATRNPSVNGARPGSVSANDTSALKLTSFPIIESSSVASDDDPFAQDIEPFDEISLRR